MQIAAIKVSENLTVLATYNQFCRPVVNPVLSDYFVNLTGITNEKIAQKGIPFLQAYEQFINFVNQDICFSHAWGSKYSNESDGIIIKENLKLYNIKNACNLIFCNIAEVFKELYLKNNILVKAQSSGQIASILNVEYELVKLGINQHNALYDVYSILAGLKHFQKDIIKLEADEFKLR